MSNYFMIAIASLQFLAAAQYIRTGNKLLALLIFLYGLTNLVLYWMGEK